jgi:hypothetical protein
LGSQQQFYLYTIISLSILSEKKFVFGTTITLSLAAMIIGSHFGSNLTHGEDFVWQPLRNDKEVEEKITDSSSLFAAAIRPFLDQNVFPVIMKRKRRVD